MLPHKEIEGKVKELWEREKAYEKLKELEEERKREGKFLYFLDGPPYVTGDIHPGTAWNKSMKDAYIRFYRMLGYAVRDQPGFDTHGLPIEVKVEKELGIKDKGEIERIGIDKFIEHCKAFADRYIKLMTERFKSFAVWMDWERPYITYKDSYIEKTWGTIKKAHEKGLLEEGFYVLPYCWRCETTLANYELEYKDRKDPSIYVKFPVKGREGEYLLVWTTTPWTLVANLAVMAHPNESYVRVKVGEEVWILAKARMDEVLSKVGESGIVLEEVKGKQLEGLPYSHPFEDLIGFSYDRKVVLSDTVSMEEGTGLVHTAPGHGPEDYKVGKAYGMPIFSPVDEKGLYTKEAGSFAGKHVLEANEEIIKILEERGALALKESITHRYPHCWRCKNPLIFRATKQWFITISKFKDKMKEEALKVEWLPKYAGERFLIFLENAPDWCISRQRYWGIPLPIWRCGEGHITVVGSVEELEKLGGKRPKELHRPYVDEVTISCPVCGKKAERVKDVLDVWFDSGNAPWASLEEGENIEPVADAILEGQDQIRGWFYSLMGSGIVALEKAPYKKVIMHGFFLDEKGEKMSKSLGNFIPVDEILERAGADAFRLFVLSNTPWDDLKFSWKEMDIARRELATFLNMVDYAFSKKPLVERPAYWVEDEYILSKLNSLIKFYREEFPKGFAKAVKGLRHFLMEDVSRFYMKLAKERIKRGDGTAVAVLQEVLKKSLLLLAPIVPYFADYVWAIKLKRKGSIHHQLLPEVEVERIKPELEDKVDKARDVVEEALSLRNERGIGLRWPLRKLTSPPLEGTESILKRMVNVKDVEWGEKVELDFEMDEELLKEGYANEIARRLQAMRKEMGLKEGDPVKVAVEGDEELMEAWKAHRESIAERAHVVDGTPSAGVEKVWKIKGKELRVRMEKVEE